MDTTSRILSGPGGAISNHVLQLHSLEVIERAIESIDDGELRRQVVDACADLLRQVEPLALLVADAPQVMAGSSDASIRFRSLLERLTEGAPDSTWQRNFEPNLDTAGQHVEDDFVRLEPVIGVAIALGSLQIDENHFNSLAEAL